jgi:hypothetical protein
MKTLPRAASRLPFKGAMPAARQSRFCGILGSDIPRLKALLLVGPIGSSLCASQPGGGHITGMLRVEAVSSRRAVTPLGRAWV